MTPKPRGRRRALVVMFVDIAGFTALAEAHGDDSALRTLDSFSTVVRDVASTRGLREVKAIGDAFLFTRDSAPAAVDAGQEIVRRLDQVDGHPAVRVGIHRGAVVEREGDVFGRTVNLAARVAAAAAGGQVLVTAEVLAETTISDARSMGPYRLRNLPQPVDLFEISGRTSGKVRDPVCRMRLSDQAVAGTHTFEGRRYSFCSEDCLRAFLHQPAAYVNA
jgi:adenylate cyclase